jgi:hypothetical protein
MIKKLSLVIILSAFSFSYSMSDEIEETLQFLKELRSRNKSSIDFKEKKQEHAHEKLARFSEAPRVIPVQPSEIIKHKVTYDELIENFARFRDAKNFDDVILDKETLLKEAELQISIWENLSNKNREQLYMTSFGLLSLACLFTAVVPWTGSGDTIFKSSTVARIITSAIAGGGSLLSGFGKVELLLKAIITKCLEVVLY